ncbi:TraB/GumN family protein [Flavisolibacter ginsenosidimutans]|uniref:TraB/GumN family protein n=1 Tax=Flavisolibacter ginsenosidimutans TaxID=661481 RepID=A0A5B8UGB3_9BACT|nr:TraB/GumN family protein [Flavisolibacter ginsenosidimutans]QEC55140.1 TraB/GumN family protein [Flavisolibacter ginsenosidimutans]
MKKLALLSFLFAATGLVACGQKTKSAPRVASTENTLLWRISGKNLSKPSYLFGTMHLLCGDDIALSDSLKAAIQNSDNVYLELEMDNLFEMMGAMQHMSMKGDTTLADLLSKQEYQKVKTYFEANSTMLPFSMLETFKPMLAASLIAEQQSKTTCDNMVAMESLIMEEAKSADKKIKGLETMNYQLSIFDKIPYKLQAKQLYDMISKTKDTTESHELAVLTDAYRNQQLDKLGEMTVKEDMGMKNFTELFLYNRNANWAKKLNELMPGKSLVVAVGAGHLPGKKGVISLLRQEGYKVEPVKNEMVKKGKSI